MLVTTRSTSQLQCQMQITLALRLVAGQQHSNFITTQHYYRHPLLRHKCALVLKILIQEKSRRILSGFPSLSYVNEKETNMNQRIIYPTDAGGVAVIIPAPECDLTIEEIAAKDVPAGKPYKIFDVADIPSDRTFRDAWEYTA